MARPVLEPAVGQLVVFEVGDGGVIEAQLNEDGTVGIHGLSPSDELDSLVVTITASSAVRIALRPGLGAVDTVGLDDGGEG